MSDTAIRDRLWGCHALWRTGILLMLAGCVGWGCQSRQAGTAPFRWDEASLGAMDAAVERHIGEGRLPGGVLWLEHEGVIHQRAYGRRSLEPSVEPMTLDTVFDAASLTKVLATTPAVMKLVERGRVDPDRPVREYWPAWQDPDWDDVTVRHLLTHTSGLRPGLSLKDPWQGSEAALQRVMAEKPTRPPGTAFVYSDINFILLGALVEQVDGRSLDRFCEQEIFGPLGMRDTGFRRIRASSGPDPVPLERVAPTERLADGSVVRGQVHDPTARRMDGVAGHAGVFTTALDVARFSRMVLAGGVGERGRLFGESTVREMVRVQTAEGLPARGLGWDIDSPYAGPRGRHFPVGSYGHTGWTGTSLWVDPGSRTFVIFMSNRNHPTEAGDVRALRRELGTLAAEALGDGPWPWTRPPQDPALSAVGPEPDPVADVSWDLQAGIPGAGAGASDRPDVAPIPGVLNGIDVLVRERFAALKGKRVGLITNHTGHDRERRSTIDLLHEAPGVELVALFSPEHGIRGVLDEKVADDRDVRTGLPIYSLYGDRRAPKEEQLAGIDLLVFDIQDIGCRFYTYISTLGHCMEVAGKVGVPMMVLDRINPIRGDRIEGPVLTGPRSFVAWHEIPLRHGMTVGELARLFRAERGMDVDLRVVPVEGWRRSDWMDASGLPWTNPSPNMRSLTQATLYPAVGVLEFCAISVGRGTDTPFERMGAPYVDDLAWARALNRMEVPGVRFVPVRFTPTASKFMGQECGGVQILLTDRDAYDAGRLGLALAVTLHRLYGDRLELDRMDRLMGDRATLEAIRAGQGLDSMLASWQDGLNRFARRRQQHLLY